MVTKRKRKSVASEEMGWLWIHGMSAGCMSIATWEVLRHVLTGGPLFLTYGVITVVTLGSVKVHHSLKQRPKRRVRRPKEQNQ